MESTTTPSDDTNYTKTMQLIAKGILEQIEPPLTTMRTHLKELVEKQEAVQSEIMKQSRDLDDLQKGADFEALMEDVSSNTNRLVSFSNMMAEIHSRVDSLAARALIVEKAAKEKAAHK